jgi:environmental stress-induced protein Ves
MDPAAPLYLPAHACQRERPGEPGLWTRNILAMPLHGGSLAMALLDVEQPTPLPVRPGCGRELVLLAGEAAALDSGDGRRAGLEPPYGRARFEPDVPVRVVPSAGTVQLLELAWSPARLEASVLHRPLVGPLYCFTGEGTGWVVHLLAGTAAISGGDLACSLERGDSAWLPAGARQRYVVEGAGEALLMRIDRAGQALALSQ